MIQSINMNLDDSKHLSLVAKALSVEVRIEILKLLCSNDYNINEIAERLNLAPSTAASHVKVLEEAGLIRSTLLPGVRGSMKRCSLQMDKIGIEVSTKETFEDRVETIHMPIGNYVDYKVVPTCGLVSAKGPIDEDDEPRCFYNPARTSAKLLWLGGGYVEYRFPNNLLKDGKEKAIEISAELCSEDHDYNMEYPSDITLWVNGYEAGTWDCPSDFGGRRGRLNPDWWPDKNSQYGMLKTWRITQSGTFLDDVKVSDMTIEEYQLSQKEFISVKLGIKEDAVNKGGMNVFGDCFGDYEQDIILKIFF